MIVNLTPHAVNLVGNDGTATIPPSGRVARVTTTETEVGRVEIDGVTIPIVTTSYGEVTDLPEPDGATRYVVSRVVRAARPDRDDLLVPTQFIRADSGAITGAMALSID